MESEVLKHVEDDNFTDFSKAVKQELSKRIYSHPEFSKKRQDFERYKNAEKLYTDVKGTDTDTDTSEE